MPHQSAVLLPEKMKKPQEFTRRGSPGSKIDAYEIVQPR
jgi:hypothetical protein